MIYIFRSKYKIPCSRLGSISLPLRLGLSLGKVGNILIKVVPLDSLFCFHSKCHSSFLIAQIYKEKLKENYKILLYNKQDISIKHIIMFIPLFLLIWFSIFSNNISAAMFFLKQLKVL